MEMFLSGSGVKRAERREEGDWGEGVGAKAVGAWQEERKGVSYKHIIA